MLGDLERHRIELESRLHGVHRGSRRFTGRRRYEVSNWARVDEMPSGGFGPAEDHILRVFPAYRHLAGFEDERALLAGVLTFRKSATLQEASKSFDGG